jgi:predicted nucleic-acid-binding protein
VIAVDTNVLVRLLAEDDPAQAERAARLFAENEIFIPKTVMLETEWVLRHAYEIDRKRILEAFHRLMGLANVKLEDPQVVDAAVSWYADGLDFADALHLGSSGNVEGFATFDRSLLRKAGRVSTVNLIAP